MTDIEPPAKKPRLYWEDFSAGQTLSFGHHEVTRESVLSFARDFDPQPFHLDDAAAGRSLFGRLAASGWHTCSMAMRMMCDGYLLDSASLGAPGVDELRWPHPVYPGDTLHMRITVLSTRALASRPTVGLVESRSEVLNQHGELVLTMRGPAFIGRRHAALP